jgi:hypothetical protein
MTLGKGYVAAQRGQDARMCSSEQSHPRAEKNKWKISQAASQATKCSDVLGSTRSVPTFSGHFLCPHLPRVWDASYKPHFRLLWWLKFCSLTWDHVQVTVGDRLNYIELLSASQCDPENVQRPEGISCINQRVLLTPDCDLPVSSSIYWLGIQNPPLEWIMD